MARRHCQWNGPTGVEGFVKNTINRFGGRLSALYDFDDLYQEAFVLFSVVRKRYATRIHSPAQFQAIFGKCLNNRFVDIVRLMHRPAEGHHLGDNDTRLVPVTNRGDDICLVNRVKEAPKEIGRMLARLGLLDSYNGRKYIKTHLWGRETPAGFVKRIAGSTDSKCLLGLALRWAKE